MLVVDDEQNLVRVLEARLRQSGYVTLSAFNAASALMAMRRYPIGAVVLDLSLPDLDGLDALRAMRAIQPELPVVLISPYARPDELDPEIVFLQKPFDIEELVRSVDQVLAGGASGRDHAGYSPFIAGRLLLVRAPSDPVESSHRGVVEWQNLDTLEVSFNPRDYWPERPGVGEELLISSPGTDALYEFRSTVLAWRRDNHLTLRKPDLIQRVQRRVEVRKPVRFMVMVRSASQPEDLPVAWTVRNISENGLMMEGKGAFAAGERLVLQPLEGSEAGIQWESEVVWTRKRGDSGLSCAGLRFVTLPFGARRWLSDYWRNLTDSTSS